MGQGIAGPVLLGLAYLGLAAWAYPGFRDSLFLDGLAYLQLARHVVAGRWALSVSGCWSPLFPWLMVPLLAAGLAPLATVHLVEVATGLLQALAAAHLGRRLGLEGPWLGLAVAGVAVQGLASAARMETPDLLVSAMLLWVLAELLDLQLEDPPGRAARVGALAGAAYLAKAYALPYFLVLVPLVLSRRPGASPARVLRAALPAWGLALAISLPWIGVLSATYGRPMLSSAGGINHAILGPGWPYADHPVEYGLWPVEPGRLQAWEDPTEHPYRRWSPLASAANLRHQARVVLFGMLGPVFTLSYMDPLHLRLWTLLGLVLLPLGLRGRDDDAARELRRVRDASLLALLLYHGGYLPLLNLPTRYYYPTQTLLHLWTLRMAQGALAGRGPGLALGAALALGLGAPPLRALAEGRGTAAVDAALVRLAADLREAGVAGPVASTRFQDAPLAIHLDHPFLGTPLARSPGALAAELAEAGATVLVAWEGENPAVPALAAAGVLRPLAVAEVPGGKRARAYAFEASRITAVASEPAPPRVVPVVPAGIE